MRPLLWLWIQQWYYFLFLNIFLFLFQILYNRENNGIINICILSNFCLSIKLAGLANLVSDGYKKSNLLIASDYQVGFFKLHGILSLMWQILGTAIGINLLLELDIFVCVILSTVDALLFPLILPLLVCVFGPGYASLRNCGAEGFFL